MNEDTEEASRWQPVILYIRNNKRVECDTCHALAVVVIGTLGEHGLEDVGQWCQGCYLQAQREEMEAS